MEAGWRTWQFLWSEINSFGKQIDDGYQFFFMLPVLVSGSPSTVATQIILLTSKHSYFNWRKQVLFCCYLNSSRPPQVSLWLLTPHLDPFYSILSCWSSFLNKRVENSRRTFVNGPSQYHCGTHLQYSLSFRKIGSESSEGSGVLAGSKRGKQDSLGVHCSLGLEYDIFKTSYRVWMWILHTWSMKGWHLNPNSFL